MRIAGRFEGDGPVGDVLLNVKEGFAQFTRLVQIMFVARFERVFNCERDAGGDWPIAVHNVAINKIDRQTYTIDADIVSKVFVEAPVSLYQQRNATFEDQSVLVELALGGPWVGFEPYWRITIKLANQSEQLFCVHIVVSIRQIRKREHYAHNSTGAPEEELPTEDAEEGTSSTKVADQKEEHPDFNKTTSGKVDKQKVARALISALLLDWTIWSTLIYKIIELGRGREHLVIDEDRVDELCGVEDPVV
ncbi:hypothetical protein AAG570_008779 [Ranatra chinensis]|uniref:Uncharacterized protein n=1 Tax=Ranatra chinensis TaxID=642074 RepID=A0ABD0Z2K1_9HEMI